MFILLLLHSIHYIFNHVQTTELLNKFQSSTAGCGLRKLKMRAAGEKGYFSCRLNFPILTKHKATAGLNCHRFRITAVSQSRLLLTS